MTTRWTRLAVFQFGMVAALSAPLWAGPARPANGCSNAILTGNYGFAINGTTATNVPITSVGQLITNGNGTIAGTETVSENGVVGDDVYILGNYSISPNCTGTMTIQPQGRSVENFAVTVLSNGRQLNLVEVDTGSTQVGTAQAQGVDACPAAGIIGVYGLQATGTQVGVGPLVFAGGVVSHGDGTLNGSATVSINGSIFSSQRVSGAFKIGAQCNGKAVLQIGSQGPIHLNLVVVNGGRELLFIQEDANTLVSGSLQK